MADEFDVEEYMVNFDNYINVENKFSQDNVTETEFYWKKLLECNFEEESLAVYFETLTEEDRTVYFKFAIDCMINFVQANFTGPELSNTFRDFFGSSLFEEFDFRNWLSINTEEINVNTKYPALLCAAISIFKHCKVDVMLNLWWQWRCLMIHQQILDELSPVLLLNADRIHTDLHDFLLDEPRLQALLELEQVQLYQIYRNINKSEEHLKLARELLDIHYEMEGSLGKRTKYQEKEIAQLRLFISLSVNGVKEVVRPDVNKFAVPKNLVLDDDVRLDTVKFSTDVDLPKIPDFEQKYLLAVVQQMIISQPRDSLYYEEIKPFIDYLLSQNNTWTVRVMLLLMRCRLEATHKRTIERCFLQCEEVVNSIKRAEPHILNRFGGVYCTNFPPLWKIEAQLAELMLNTGLIKASLDVYLKLELWEEVIVCYTLLKMRHKAAEIIKERLEANPTVKLWCLLGDATDDVSCYDKAWELSKKRSSRAQRHWGEYFYYRKEYPQCIPHFEKSVSINPLQVKVWVRYGFAALETENWQTAATAYKRYTMLEPGNFQAWNNLAKAYIKLGNKHGAHQALHDAIKCNFENWKVWDNLMAVSVSIKNFSDVVNAYHRILDLKGKHLDVEVLESVVAHGLITYGEVNSQHLMPKFQELLARVTSIYPTKAYLWELYATLVENSLKKAELLQKCLTAGMQIGWEKDIHTRGEVLHVCRLLADVVLMDVIKPTDSLINSVRLSMTSCLSIIKKHEFNDRISLNFNKVTELLQLIVEKCKSGTCTENVIN